MKYSRNTFTVINFIGSLFLPSTLLASEMNGYQGEKMISHKLLQSRAELSPVTIRVDEAYFETYQGVIMYGAHDSDLSGRSVSGAGDINGDGIADILIGADNADPLGVNDQNSGSSYIIYGQDRGYKAQIKLADLNATLGFRLDGATADDVSGSHVSQAGDFNNDGLPDIIIGAYDAQTPNGKAGASYVVFGTRGGYSGPISLGNLGTKGFRIYGTALTSSGLCNGQPCDIGNRLGWSNRGAGDVNGDSINDIIIGAYATPRNGQDFAGSVYIIYGNTGGYQGSLNMGAWGTFNPPIGFRIDGFQASSYVGYGVSSAGDFNGDGLSDIIFSAPGASPFGRTQAGSVYLIYGKLGGYPTINLANFNTSLGFRIDGATAYFLSGTSTNIASAGDVNNDGFDDIIIGSLFSSPNNRTNAGSAYILYGREKGYPNLDLANFNSTLGFRIDGESPYDGLGLSVSFAGDVNADKIDDIIVGAPEAYDGAGAAYIIYGRSGGYPSSLDVGTLSPYHGFRIRGRAGGDFFATSTSGAGDFNNDGFDDIVGGAWQYSSPLFGASVGASYVVYGFNQPPILAQNTLTVIGEQSLTLDRNNLYINDTDTTSERLTFEVVALQNGVFSKGNQSNIMQFTQQDIDEGKIEFTSTRCNEAPTYSIQISDVAHTTTPSVAEVFYTPTCNSASSAPGADDRIGFSLPRLFKSVISYWQPLKPAMNTPEAEALMKLKDKCEHLIKGADEKTVDPWYRYNLEDVLQEIQDVLKTPSLVRDSTINRFEAYLMDLDKAYLKHPLKKKPSFFSTSNLITVSEQLSANMNGVWPQSMLRIEGPYVPPFLGK